MGSGGGFAGLYLFEEPDDSDAEEAEEGQPAEDVYESPVSGLTLELLVKEGLGGVGGVGCAEVASYCVGGRVDAVLELLAALGNVVDDQVLVDGAAAGEECLRNGDSDGSAYVTH